MAHVYRILEGPIALLLPVTISMKSVQIVKMKLVVLFRLMTEVRDNTLIILENNSLADIAFKQLNKNKRPFHISNEMVFCY
jgi:DNA-binding IscR family transcriptional regulator